MSKKLEIKLEWRQTKAELLGLYNLNPKFIVESSSEKDKIALFKEPVFTKNRFFAVRGWVDKQETCCFTELEHDWSYCPSCGDSIDKGYYINETFRDQEKARNHEKAIELGIEDLFVVMVEEKEDVYCGEKEL